jgi:transposase-like protein
MYLRIRGSAPAELSWQIQLAGTAPFLQPPPVKRLLKEVEIAETGMIVHLKDYGMIKVFKIVATDGDIEYWATNDLQMGELTRVKYAGEAWTIEQFHRGIKQFSGIERCQARSRRGCLHCGSENLVRDGFTPKGKQRYWCHDCNRSSRDNPQPRGYSEAERERILAAYEERSSLRGLERVFGVSRKTVSQWLKKKKPHSQT